MTREISIKEATDIYNYRGVRHTKELLDSEYSYMLAEIALEDKLKGSSFIKLYDDLSEFSLEYVFDVREHFFIQGYLAAKGYEDGICTEANDVKPLAGETVKAK